MTPLLVTRDEFALTIHPQTREGLRHPQFSGYDRWDSLTGPKRNDNVYQNWKLIKDEKVRVSPPTGFVAEKSGDLAFYRKSPVEFKRPDGSVEANTNLLGVIACDNATCKLVSVFWD